MGKAEKKEKKQMKEGEEEVAKEIPPTSTLPGYLKLQRIGKGKQGRCFLVRLEGEEKRAVLKEFKGGSRHAFGAEVAALTKIQGSACISAGIVPQMPGADPRSRQVLISYFPGLPASEVPFVPALACGTNALSHALACWLAAADAVEAANSLGVIHCDVNPWNLLVATQDVGFAVSEPAACLVDWACASCAGAASTRFSRRGDFQPAELLAQRVGPRTDVFGCAATLLWLLAKRTRKAVEISAASLTALLASTIAMQVEDEVCSVAVLEQ